MKHIFLLLSAMAINSHADLPDPLVANDGKAITDAAAWEPRRAEMKTILQDEAIGHAPQPPGNVTGETVSEKTVGKTLVKRVRLRFGPGVGFDVMVLMPEGAGKKAVVVHPSFDALPDDAGLEAFTEKYRQALDRGYALAVFCYLDVRGDEGNAPAGAIHDAYLDNDWGGLAMWAWAMSRCVDWLEKQDFTDTSRIIGAGFSRLGKATLIAGAFDERFAVTAPVGSGCAGAGLYRLTGEGRGGKEGLEDVVRKFPHWIGPGLAKYGGKVEDLPFDQHWLIALVAPRKFIAADALQDPFTSQKAVEGAVSAARPVFTFLGAPENLSLHFREGGHDFAEEDWKAVLDFAEKR